MLSHIPAPGFAQILVPLLCDSELKLKLFNHAAGGAGPPRAGIYGFPLNGLVLALWFTAASHWDTGMTTLSLVISYHDQLFP